MILPLKDHTPRIGERTFIAPDAWVIGDVELEAEVSVFFGAVLRGDILPLKVGQGTNIQEHALLHTSHGRTPTIIGNHVTIGHRAIVHGATVGDRCLIGMGATVLDEAVIGQESLIGAGALITEGAQIPPRSLVLGVPGKVVRTLSGDEAAKLLESAQTYIKTGAMYAELLKKTAP